MARTESSEPGGHFQTRAHRTAALPLRIASRALRIASRAGWIAPWSCHSDRAGRWLDASSPWIDASPCWIDLWPHRERRLASFGLPGDSPRRCAEWLICRSFFNSRCRWSQCGRPLCQQRSISLSSRWSFGIQGRMPHRRRRSALWRCVAIFVARSGRLLGLHHE